MLRGRDCRQDSGGKFLLGEESKRFIIGRDQYEACPQHKGERAHDTAMAQDAGVRAGSAVPGGCDVFYGWATEERRFQLWQSSAKRRWVLAERQHKARGEER